MRLKDKVAIITGSGGGMGRAASILFAQEGCKVVVDDIKEEMGRDTVKMIKDSGGEAIFIGADISKVEDVKDMVKLAIEKFGRLNILYNNAAVGLLGQDRAVTDMLEEDWDKVLNSNLRGMFLCCKYAIPEMIRSGGGSIINTSSPAALFGTRGPLVMHAYSSSKGGVISLTRAIAISYSRQKIRANVIIPGFIDTPMAAPMLQDPKVRDMFAEATPLGRIGTPEDVAMAALFLASDEASFITGAVLTVDGGATAAIHA